MSSKGQLSYSALLQEIELWEITLRRELKRLAFLKQQSRTDSIASRKIVNRIEVLETEIEGVLLKYRKEKDKKLVDFDYVMGKYDLFSREFVQLMENVNELQQDLLPNGTENSEPTRIYVPGQSRRSNKSNKSNNTPETLVANTIPAKTIINHLNQTFASNMARQKRATSDRKAPPTKAITAKLMGERQWLDGMLETSHLRKVDRDRVTVPKNNPYQRQKKSLLQAHNHRLTKQRINRSTQQNSDDTLPIDSIVSLKSQLNQVKTNVLQMHRKIDSHVHDDYDHDIKKLRHNNRKMLADIKVIKQQNTTLMQEVFQARKQIAEEKKLQAQMVREFERPRIPELDKQVTYSEDVSDWVKVRLDKLAA